MKKTVGGLVVAVLLLATACSSSSGSSDGPTDGDYKPPSQWTQVGGNSYVYTFCDHGNRIYWVSSNTTDSLSVVPGDETCN